MQQQRDKSSTRAFDITSVQVKQVITIKKVVLFKTKGIDTKTEILCSREFNNEDCALWFIMNRTYMAMMISYNRPHNG